MGRNGIYRSWTSLLALVALMPPGCDRARERPGDTHAHEPSSVEATGGTIAIPPAVRKNLGITFVTVERRPVRRTLRLPGQFELQPRARHEYHVMLSGRVELVADQYQRVEEGDVLFYLESPEWRGIQDDLVSAYNEMRRSHAEVAVAEAALREAQQAVSFLDERIAGLTDVQVRVVELEAEAAEERNKIPGLLAKLEAARVGFDAAHTRYDVALNAASSVSGIPVTQLDTVQVAHGHLSGETPAWGAITRLTVKAEAAGVVNRLEATNLGWAEAGALVMDTINPTALRFHADALQTDVGRLRDGLPARIVPPQGGTIQLQATAEGSITVGFQAHSEQRTVPVFVIPDQLPSWAKAGVMAYLEVYVDGPAEMAMAIPASAVVRDGLDMVFFRRNPSNPDEAIRTVADLGASDGRWVELQSGVGIGDEVVLGGVYPLMLASSTGGERMQGGHFHADGTFHGEDH